MDGWKLRERPAGGHAVVETQADVEVSGTLEVLNKVGDSLLKVSEAGVSLFGQTEATQPTAYTPHGTATKTFPADPSAAYNGLADGQPATPYAAVADLNTLRAAVSSLEGVVAQIVADLEALGLVAES
jgi:hypothetical protein